MKIKAVKKDVSSQLFDCEDVTVTYYMEDSVAFQNAQKNWTRGINKLRADVTARQVALEAARNTLADYKRKLQTAEATIEIREQQYTLFRRLLGMIVPTLSRKTRKEDARLQDERRHYTAQISVADDNVARLDQATSAATTDLHAAQSDPVTPGIELTIRMRNRRQVVIGLPSHADVVYVENDEGRTIDTIRWPVKAVPAALGEI